MLADGKTMKRKSREPWARDVVRLSSCLMPILQRHNSNHNISSRHHRDDTNSDNGNDSDACHSSSRHSISKNINDVIILIATTSNDNDNNYNISNLLEEIKCQYLALVANTLMGSGMCADLMVSPRCLRRAHALPESPDTGKCDTTLAKKSYCKCIGEC